MTAQPQSPTQNGRIPILLAVDDGETGTWLRHTLAEHALVDIIGEAQDGLEAAQMAREAQPMACVIQVELPVMDGYQTCELLSLAAPEVATVLVHTEPWTDAMQSAMRVGARGYVAAGSDGHTLLEILTDIAAIAERRKSREFAQVTDPAKMPAVVAVSAAKGGVGKTTVAVNLAVTMAQRFPNETVLVDCYSQYGDAAVMLGLSSRRGIIDLASESDLDEPRIQAHLVAHKCGLKLLPGAIEPGTGVDVLPADFTARLLTALRRQFRVIILDLPPVLNAATGHLMSRSRHFLVVCNFLELTALRDTSVLIHSVAGKHIGGDRIRIIGNRVRPKNRYMAKDLEQATGYPVAHQIPDAGDLALASVNTGIPFVLSHPQAPVSASIRALADMVDPRPEVRQPQEHAPARAGLLRRVFAKA
jgi:pilus assembly protein CpaE